MNPKPRMIASVGPKLSRRDESIVLLRFRISDFEFRIVASVIQSFPCRRESMSCRVQQPMCDFQWSLECVRLTASLAQIRNSKSKIRNQMSFTSKLSFSQCYSHSLWLVGLLPEQSPGNPRGGRRLSAGRQAERSAHAPCATASRYSPRLANTSPRARTRRSSTGERRA